MAGQVARAPPSGGRTAGAGVGRAAGLFPGAPSGWDGGDSSSQYIVFKIYFY